jgi:hypothetical protein
MNIPTFLFASIMTPYSLDTAANLYISKKEMRTSNKADFIFTAQELPCLSTITVAPTVEVTYIEP